MNILIIGSGGREHSLAITYAKSKRVKQVFVAPGNDFMLESNKKIQTIPEIGVLDFDKIVAFVKKQSIDIVDVASDDPLGAGLIDILTENGVTAFGPHKNAAEIEWNKAWAREFMKKYGLPIPSFKTFTDQNEAITYVKKEKMPLLFIKAAGLAAGKGVIKAENQEETIDAINKMKAYGNAGKSFVIEHGLTGEEFSLFAICDGKKYQIISSAQDHKTAYTGDTGQNTGGMGCVTPPGVLTKQTIKTIQQTILDPFIRGMQNEKRPYVGILYLGGMMTKKGPMIVEFNARWGDPEAEVILPGLTNDYVTLVESVLIGDLKKNTLKHDGKIRISVTGCARGYPGDYSQSIGRKIYGLENVSRISGITVFGAGIKRKNKHYVVNGGRIFHLVTEGNTIYDARKKAYEAMSQIFVEGNNLHYRTDIGWREVQREYTA